MREIDLERVAALKAREDARFAAERPRSRELLERARRSMPLGVPMSWMAYLYDHPPLFVAEADGNRFRDVDGHEYRDFNLAITVAFCGHTPGPVIEAVGRRMRQGTQFQLPTEDAIAVAEELGRRFGLPKWQFTLSSSQANAEAIRLARLATGRSKVLLFDGKYHGHHAETLAVLEDGVVRPEYLGISAKDVERTLIVPFNDLRAVEQALAGGDVALLLSEPALTNSGIVLPEPGFHEGIRGLTRSAGAILAIDETQTHPAGLGGLIREWGLDPDVVVLGKSLGGGIPVAAYGMNAALADVLERPAQPYEVSGEAVDEPAIGGTLFANALSMAACRAVLEQVLTPEAYARTRALASRLADGIEAAIERAGFAWSVYRLGNRSGWCFSPSPPRNAVEAAEVDVPPLRHLTRVYMANRGIWEFGWWAGPMISAAASAADVAAYLAVLEALLAELTAGGPR